MTETIRRRMGAYASYALTVKTFVVVANRICWRPSGSALLAATKKDPWPSQSVTGFASRFLASPVRRMGQLDVSGAGG
jgi:hypothetical protein